MEYERVFMMYLPRICEHCLNPSCVASCPSGAMYKREEDGIVLVDQEACRGWRMCVSNCPYKKVYFNWQSGKAEKCTLCYPRIEAGMPTICAETCVGPDPLHRGGPLRRRPRGGGRLGRRPEGPARRPARASSSTPRTRRCAAQAEADGIPADWIDAARRSPVYALGDAPPRGPAAAPRVPHPADGLVRPAAVAGDGDDRGRGQHGRPRRRLPGHRPAAHPGPLPLQPARRRRRRGDPRACSSSSRRCALHARARARRRGRRAGARLGRYGASPTWRTCTGCWRSPSTRSASSSRGPRRAGRHLSAQQGACGLDFAGGPGGCGANGRATRAEEPARRSTSPAGRRRPSRSPGRSRVERRLRRAARAAAARPAIAAPGAS